MTADYSDWGGLQTLQSFLTSLNLASQSLQASANDIASAIASAGVPPYVPSLKSASVDSQGYGTPNLLSNIESDIRLWGAWISASLWAGSSYSTANNSPPVFVAANSTLSEVTTTLIEVQLAITAAGNHDRADMFLPLGGVELAASGTQVGDVYLSVNGGTSISNTLMRVAAGILYTQP